MEHKISRVELRDLFRDQLNDLSRLGYPVEIINEFKLKETELLDKSEKINIPEGHLPFIPVVPESILSYRDQASFVSQMSYLKSTLDVRGQRYYLLDKCRNTYAPIFGSKPYYLIDVALVNDSKLSGYLKINHEEGFAIAAFKQELIMSKIVIAATACTWEGQETAIIHLDFLESGFGHRYTAADWGMVNTYSSDFVYGFCLHRLI